MKKSTLEGIFPFIAWYKEITPATLRADIIAGITGAVIVLPQGVAFAMIAGLPPIFGLYTAMVLPIVAALFGSSKHLISGPTTAISLVVYSSISQLAEPGTASFIEYTIVLTLLAGVMQLIFGIVRLGALVNFVSHTVVLGFTAGAAILIFTSQLRNITGLTKSPGEGFFDKWIHFFVNIQQLNVNALLIGLLTLVIAVIIKKLKPRFPNMLTAMVVAGLLTYFFGPDRLGISVIGTLPSGLPPFKMPDLSTPAFQKLLPNAFAIALLGLIEAVAIARSIALKSGQQLDANQEFIGQGLSNITGSFFSSYAGSGSFTRSGVNYDAGAKSPLAAVAAAVFLVIILLLVAPLAAFIPIAGMAGIIMYVSYNLIDFKHIKSVLRTSKRESTVLIITFISTLTLELEFAIYLGVIFSLIFYLQRTSQPRIVRVAPDPGDPRRRIMNVEKYHLQECPQLIILRIEGSIFFGAVNHVAAELFALRDLGIKNLLIIGGSINLIDTSGAEMLVNEAVYWQKNGGGLYISGLKLRARESMHDGGFAGQIGTEYFFDDKEEAILSIYNRLDAEKCKACPVKIFKECKAQNMV